MTAPTYKLNLREKCHQFLRPKMPVRVQKIDEIMVKRELSKREVLLEQLKDLGVSTFKVDS